MPDKRAATVVGASRRRGPGSVGAFPTRGCDDVKPSRPGSHLRVLAGTILGAALLSGSPISAQQPAAPNPLDIVPEQMPFDVPYGAPISLEAAQGAINAAVAEAKKRDWKMNVAVVDSGGNLVAFQRMDGAQLASIQIAEHKARAAVTFRRETKVFENGIQLNHFNYLLTLDGIVASRGGIPLVGLGKMIGGIGCSGGTGSQDEMVCKAGAAMVK